MHRSVRRIGFGDHDVGGVDGPAQQRGVHHGGLQARVPNQPACQSGLLAPPCGEVEVEPSAEPVVGIGGALTVPQQDEGAHVSASPRSSAAI